MEAPEDKATGTTRNTPEVKFLLIKGKHQQQIFGKCTLLMPQRLAHFGEFKDLAVVESSQLCSLPFTPPSPTPPSPSNFTSFMNIASAVDQIFPMLLFRSIQEELEYL